jgi:hypothetical protein
MSNKNRGFFGERPLPTFEVDSQVLRRRTRRDLLLFGVGAAAGLAVPDPFCRKRRSPVWAWIEVCTPRGRSGF